MAITDQPTPTYRVIAFDATKAGIIPTRVIQASHTETGDGGTNDKRKKEAKQAAGAVPASVALGAAYKTVMQAPAPNASLKTLVIPGFVGPS